MRARSRKCPSCLGSGKDTALTVEPDEHSPLETPADLCHDLVLASVEDQPAAWLPFNVYRDHDFRAVLGQMGFVQGRAALAFPVRLRENGIDTSSLKRCAAIAIGRKGSKALHLAVRPVPVPLPPDVRASWLRAWPGAGNDVDDDGKPATPAPTHRYADVPAQVAAFLRGRGGTALPDEIVTALHISRGAVLNARRADFLTSRRIEGGGNTQRIYLLEDGFPAPPDGIAPRESVAPMKSRSPKLPPEKLVALPRERGGSMLRADAVKALGVTAVAVRDAANACDQIDQARAGRFIHLTLTDEEVSPKPC